MLPMEDALNKILGVVEPLNAVMLPLSDVFGMFLAEDIYADIDLPPFDNSAVDGYAVRSEDTTGASPASPVILREIGDIAAGTVGSAEVTPGTAFRIMTGAPLPAGADAVVMVEDSRRQQTPEGEGVVAAILEPPSPEMHVRRAGEDLRSGTKVLSSGARIRPPEIAMLATMGRADAAVFRRPRVAIFSTGDELVEVETGVLPAHGKIRDSNRYMLAAMVDEAGASLHSVGHLPDDPEATIEALRTAASPESGADVIVTAGGVSMGDRDYVRPAVERLGSLDLWKVAIKPGKPLAFGRIGSTLIFGLPGNPISAMVTFELFVRPALRKMAGGSGKDLARDRVSATVMDEVHHTPGRREYVRAITTFRNGRFEAEVSDKQGSAMLQSAIAANSLLVVPEETADLQPGAIAEVILLP